MVETEFALKKFALSTHNLNLNAYFVNIETITAAKT